MHYYYVEDNFKSHIVDCSKKNVCGIIMPSDREKFESFKNHDHKLRVPFSIYADIESILKPAGEATAFNNSVNTKAYQEHEAFSIGLYFKSDINDGRISSSYDSYRGPDCVQRFCDRLYDLAFDIQRIYSDVKPMKISELEEKRFRLAGTCHICDKEFTEMDDEYFNYKVRDHCHLTGAFRGPAHNKCNLTFRESRTIPVIFQNLSGYDSHFIIREIASRFSGELQVIPCTDQLYISFTKCVDDTRGGATTFKEIVRNVIRFKFVDSFRFMAASLDTLSSILPSAKKSISRLEFGDLPPEKLQMLERKGVFPYDFVDSWEKLACERLPNKEAFYSRLTELYI